jgi:hypothetical protein
MVKTIKSRDINNGILNKYFLIAFIYILSASHVYSIEIRKYQMESIQTYNFPVIQTYDFPVIHSYRNKSNTKSFSSGNDKIGYKVPSILNSNKSESSSVGEMSIKKEVNIPSDEELLESLTNDVIAILELAEVLVALTPSKKDDKEIEELKNKIPKDDIHLLLEFAESVVVLTPSKKDDKKVNILKKNYSKVAAQL